MSVIFYAVKTVLTKVNKSSKWPSSGCWINPMEKPPKQTHSYIGPPFFGGEEDLHLPIFWKISISLSCMTSWYNPQHNRGADLD